jgi:hypothetical protein
MDLHPSAFLPKLAAHHAPVLSRVYGHLRVAVPETYARFSDRHPDPRDLHGMVMCSAVRDSVLCIGLNDPHMQGLSLEMSEGPARSVVLTDARGMRIRVRKFPTDRLTGDRVRVVEMPEQPTLDEDLFGPVQATAPYEIYVLWSPDVPAAALDAVFLAAVSDIDSASRVRVHAAVEILAPPMEPPADSSGVQPLEPRPDDDFDDQIDPEGEAGTDA